MNKKFFYSTALVLFFSVSNAQVKTFDLSDFKLPYLRYERLDLNFGLNSQNQFNSWKDTTNFDFSRTDINSRFNTGGIYSLYLNTPEQQSSYTIYTDIQSRPFNRSESVYNDESSEISSFSRMNFLISGSSRNRFYNRHQWFIEMGPKIDLGYNLNNFKTIEKDPAGNTTYERILKENNPQLNAGIEIGGGYGRIENVTDAQMALFILKDLLKENRLEKDPTHQEIYKLAELISRKRTQRFFDNRHRVIAQIGAIDSLLTSMGLVNQSDAIYFTTIYDNWIYANNPQRKSGFRISGGPKLDFSTSILNESIKITDSPLPDSEFKERYSYIDYGFWIRAIEEKPLNHFWQRTFSVNLIYTLSKNTRKVQEFPEEQREQNNLELTLFGGYRYFPNTRSSFSIGVQAGWRKNDMERYFYPVDFDYEDEDLIYERIFAVPNVNGYYYISPRLRLNFNGSVSYNLHKTDNFMFITPPIQNGFSYVTNNRFNIFFNAGLTYALF